MAMSLKITPLTGNGTWGLDSPTRTSFLVQYVWSTVVVQLEPFVRKLYPIVEQACGAKHSYPEPSRQLSHDSNRCKEWEKR